MTNFYTYRDFYHVQSFNQVVHTMTKIALDTIKK